MKCDLCDSPHVEAEATLKRIKGIGWKHRLKLCRSCKHRVTNYCEDLYQTFKIYRERTGEANK
jgi:uncharacterized protein YlaI